MADKLSPFMLKILREVNGDLPVSPWGAAIGEVLEYLSKNGYISKGNLTEKGREVLSEGSRKATTQINILNLIPITSQAGITYTFVLTEEGDLYYILFEKDVPTLVKVEEQEDKSLQEAGES